MRSAKKVGMNTALFDMPSTRVVPENRRDVPVLKHAEYLLDRAHRLCNHRNVHNKPVWQR
jgi:hypothetical protein